MPLLYVQPQESAAWGLPWAATVQPGYVVQPEAALVQGLWLRAFIPKVQGHRQCGGPENTCITLIEKVSSKVSCQAKLHQQIKSSQ